MINIEKYRDKRFRERLKTEQVFLESGFNENKEFREKLESLKKFLEQSSKELSKLGFPVDEENRIDYNSPYFREIYPLKERAYKKACLVEKRKAILTEHEWSSEEEKIKTRGEQFEMLKTALFSKFLEDFYVLRTSKYDDVIHHLDNILIDKETGRVVCAIDEVTVKYEDKRLREKERKILDMNFRGGGCLDFGLEVKTEAGKPKIKVAKLQKIPVFYLPLSFRAVEEGIKEFIPSKDKYSAKEVEIFAFLIRKLSTQIQKIKKELRQKAKLTSSVLVTSTSWKEGVEIFGKRVEKAGNSIEDLKILPKRKK